MSRSFLAHFAVATLAAAYEFLVPEKKLLLLQLSLPLWLLLLFLLLLRFPPWLGYRNKCYRVCRSRAGLS